MLKKFIFFQLQKFEVFEQFWNFWHNVRRVAYRAWSYELLKTNLQQEMERVSTIGLYSRLHHIHFAP